MFKINAVIDTIIREIHKFVSAKTGETNKLFKFCPSKYVWVKLPPKYLNKSIFAKMLYFNQVAPFEIKVIIRLTMYIPADKQTART